MMAVLKLVASLFVFVGILAGCVAGLFMIFLVVRFPLLLLPVLLTCWIFRQLQKTTDGPD